MENGIGDPNLSILLSHSAYSLDKDMDPFLFHPLSEKVEKCLDFAREQKENQKYKIQKKL